MRMPLPGGVPLSRRDRIEHVPSKGVGLDADDLDKRSSVLTE